MIIKNILPVTLIFISVLSCRNENNKAHGGLVRKKAHPPSIQTITMLSNDNPILPKRLEIGQHFSSRDEFDILPSRTHPSPQYYGIPNNILNSLSDKLLEEVPDLSPDDIALYDFYEVHDITKYQRGIKQINEKGIDNYYKSFSSSQHSLYSPVHNNIKPIKRGEMFYVDKDGSMHFFINEYLTQRGHIKFWRDEDEDKDYEVIKTGKYNGKADLIRIVWHDGKFRFWFWTEYIISVKSSPTLDIQKVKPHFISITLNDIIKQYHTVDWLT